MRGAGTIASTCCALLLLGCPGSPRTLADGARADSGGEDGWTGADRVGPDHAEALDAGAAADRSSVADHSVVTDVAVHDAGGLDADRDAAAFDTAAFDAAAPDAAAFDTAAPDAAAFDAAAPLEAVVGGDRPAVVKIPSGHDGSALPLIIFMHGYTSSAAGHDAWWRLSDRVNIDRFMLLLPDGTPEDSGAGHRFWNATDACCNRFGSEVDDVGYLLGLIDEVGAAYPLDTDRVYLTGHSNGGFMSYRLGCEAAERFAAIASIAGMTFLNASDCAAVTPVSVLHVHGDADTLVPYAGRPDQGVYPECPEGYPGAAESARRWAERAGCTLAAATTEPPIDLSPRFDGVDTSVLRYSAGCAAGVEVELWTIMGGRHSPSLLPDWGERLVGWLLSH